MVGRGSKGCIIIVVAGAYCLVSLVFGVGLPAEPGQNPEVGQTKGAVLKRLIFVSFWNEDDSKDYHWIQNSITDWIHKTAKKRFRYAKIPEKAWRGYMREHGLKKLGPF